VSPCRHMDTNKYKVFIYQTTVQRLLCAPQRSLLDGQNILPIFEPMDGPGMGFHLSSYRYRGSVGPDIPVSIGKFPVVPARIMDWKIAGVGSSRLGYSFPAREVNFILLLGMSATTGGAQSMHNGLAVHRPDGCVPPTPPCRHLDTSKYNVFIYQTTVQRLLCAPQTPP
jgi:hypothetical protein